MKFCITILGVVVLLSCNSAKDNLQTRRKQLIGHWIETPEEAFGLGLTEFTITDSTLSFAGQPGSLPARYEISPADSITLFYGTDTITLKIALSNDSDTLKLSGGKTGRTMYFVREEQQLP
jgi:hypothetical protein